MGYKIIPPVPGTSVAGGGVPVSLNALTTAGNATDCQQVVNVATATLTGITVAAGSNRRLVAVLSIGDIGSTPAPVTITALVSGVPAAMTQEAFIYSGTKAVCIFSIANPDTGAQSIVAAWAQNSDAYLSADCFNNVVSVNGADTQTGSTNALTMTSGANDATVTAITTNNGDPTSSQTLTYANSPLQPGGAADYALGGASNVHTYGNAGTVQVIAGIHLVAA